MPRVRGFRDPRSVRSKSSQLNRLLLSNSLRITTSRLPQSELRNVLQTSLTSGPRHVRSSNLSSEDLQTPTFGQTVAIKDNFVTRNLPTTCASHILDGFSAQDAAAVELLKEAGMSVVAKTNMDEFGMGSHSTHSAYGAVRNSRFHNALSVGGSSGGSALAVATGLVDCALGSDTGGSVRLPAAYTGIVGFKPSYGMVSRRGLIPYANSLDTVGFFGKSCLDIWLLNSLLSRPDPLDPTCLSNQTRARIQRVREARVQRDGVLRLVTHQSPLTSVLQTKLEPRSTLLSTKRPPSQTRRIGVPVEYNIQEMHHSVKKAWIRTLSNLQYWGHDIIPISLPSTQQALSAYYVLAPAEASSNLAKYDGVRYGKLRKDDFVDDANGVLYSEYRGAFFGEEVQRRILLGSFTLSADSMDNYFIQAQKVRRIVQSDFDAVFRMANPLQSKSKPNPEGVDYIICPTAPTPPPRLSEVKNASPLDSYINDVFTVPASLAGLPAISVPASQESHDSGGSETAIGIQVIGQFGDDTGVIHFARRWLDKGFVGRRSAATSEERAIFK